VRGSPKCNKFGLSRDIPAPIKRTVRQECRFGCIFCGGAFYDYEHIEPFHKVRDHIPKDIALLCGTHHGDVTRRRISKQTVREKRLNPFRLSHPWPHSNFYPSTNCFPIILGGAQFIHPKTAVRVFGQELLSIREPESEDGPIRLSAEFYDDKGKECLVIQDNELKCNPNSWDIETKGACITIRQAPRVVALRIRLCPDQLIIERMSMCYQGVQLTANERELKILSTTGLSYRLTGWVKFPDTGIEIIRDRPGTHIGVVEPRRTINVIGCGGDYTITGRQPPNADINFWGGARSLTMDADATLNVGGSPPTPKLGFAFSQRAALSLSLDDLEILIGAGARASSLSIG